MKLPAFLLALIACVLGLASCGAGSGLVIDAEGCVLSSFERDGRTWTAGTCPDGTHKVQWSNPEGIDFRALWPQGEGPVVIQYRNGPEDPWFEWGAKASVDPGPMPPGVADEQPLNAPDPPEA